MALGIWRKWRKSGIEPFGRYGQPELGHWSLDREAAEATTEPPASPEAVLHLFRSHSWVEASL